MNIGEIGMGKEKIFETKIKRFLKDEGCLGSEIFC